MVISHTYDRKYRIISNYIARNYCSNISIISIGHIEGKRLVIWNW